MSSGRLSVGDARLILSGKYAPTGNDAMDAIRAIVALDEEKSRLLADLDTLTRAVRAIHGSDEAVFASVTNEAIRAVMATYGWVQWDDTRLNNDALHSIIAMPSGEDFYGARVERFVLRVAKEHGEAPTFILAAMLREQAKIDGAAK